MTMSTLIPGAQNVVVNRYDDLTTNNSVIAELHETRRIFLAPCDYSGDGKPKKPKEYVALSVVPGLEYAGITEDIKFVFRIPDKWNGKLVVFAAPGFGDERSGDSLISDYVLTRLDEAGNSYAYAAFDKGTVGEIIPTPEGKLDPLMQSFTVFLAEDDNIVKWGRSLEKITIMVKKLLKDTRGQEPAKTYLIGMSNGGYTARFGMENFDELYDGMLDWEGVLWRANETNPIHQFSQAVKACHMMKNSAKESHEYREAAKVFSDFGLPTAGHFLIPFYNAVFFLQHLNIYRMKFDPEFCQRQWWQYAENPDDYFAYNFFERPAIVRERIAEFENSGRIRKPSITVFGNFDALIFYGMNAALYQELVAKNGSLEQYRLYTVEGGTHLDCLAGHPDWDAEKRLQPLMPYVHQAFDILVAWVEKGIAAPPSKSLPVCADGKVTNIITGDEVVPY